MNNKTVLFLAFIMGAAAGVAVTWNYAKNKYEQIAQEEIDSVKEVFSRREDGPKATIENDAMDFKTNKPDIAEYAARLQKEGYVNYSDAKDAEEEGKETMDKPYVIPPESFDDFEDYDAVSLTYYADGILADENDEIIEDVESVVGFESLSHFGEFEDDSVYVRNDARKCDYEILTDQRNYSDVAKQKPHQMEV